MGCRVLDSTTYKVTYTYLQHKAKVDAGKGYAVGIDLVSQENGIFKLSNVIAHSAGKVVFAQDFAGYGNCVVIDHGCDILTLYGHLASLYVNAGQKVTKGTALGLIGTTGNSTGIHLHFEVRKYSAMYNLNAPSIWGGYGLFSKEIYTFLDPTPYVDADIPEISKAAEKPSITYMSHVQDLGWMSPVKDGTVAGTTGRGMRMEGLWIISVTGLPAGAYIRMQGHLENIDWMVPVKHTDAYIGTTGRSLRLEAIKLKLINADGYRIKYCGHVQNLGWMDWVSDGAQCGTTGQSLRLEAVKIIIEKK